MPDSGSIGQVAVLGAGAWGSTIADMLARKGVSVRLWDHAARSIERLRIDRHPFGVPELKLHETVTLDLDLEDAVRGARIIILVVPAQAVGRLVPRLAKAIGKDSDCVIGLASKGIDMATLRPLSDVVEAALPNCSVGVVSGPCIAREVAQGIPTSVVAASKKPEHAALLRDVFVTGNLRVYTHDDVLGVELGGALKNVIAIAAGMGDGLGFGANSKSALMTRGLAEIARFAAALGANPKTIYGLSGLGDLTVTCFSPHSRNRTFGQLIGSGKTAAEARHEIGMVVEGESTALATLKLSREKDIDMPIAEVVVGICEGRYAAKAAVRKLMERELKDEFEGSPFGSG
ncbi:NAD(P)-dependent glycerol-3-phosphate dehydrogenase [bacterium]|nr:NAD(P)-dependent glycerol-3-phosphate dehydrogenase [bacterium]